jgi:hypothetical protein
MPRAAGTASWPPGRPGPADRDRAGIPITGFDAALLERFLAPARASMSREAWDAGFAAGKTLSQDQAAAPISKPAGIRDIASPAAIG